MEVRGNMESRTVCVCMFYVHKHKSRRWMPSLENWGQWVKDLLWLANSPHTSYVTDSYVNLHICIEVVTVTYLRLFGGLAILWFY